MTTSPPPLNNSRTIKIPEEVARQLEGKLARTSFGSLDDFVSFILARLAESTSETPFSEEEERQLRDRLRSLGYID
ncbi:MAG: CopG family transcriptional regulator [Thermoplasmata archaeon]|nr:CopG family transcriptional regulator [Thermoplasmata archaeon]